MDTTTNDETGTQPPTPPDSASAGLPAAPVTDSDGFVWAPPPKPPADSDEARAIAAAWADHHLWSAVGTVIGDSIRQWRIVAAVAAILGLALSVGAGIGLFKVGASVWATVGVLLLAAVPYLRQNLVSDQRVAQWTLARVASEDLKQAIFRHLMGVLQPVSDDGSPASPGATNLVRRCRTIKKTVADLAGVAAATPTPDTSGHPPPLALAIDGYVQERVVDQMTWYRRKGEYNGRLTARLRRAELLLGLLTVLMGAWASGGGSLDDAQRKAQDTATAAATRSAALVRAPGMAASDAGTGASAASAPAEARPGPDGASGNAEKQDGQGTPEAPSRWLAALALVAAATSAITAYLAASRHAELAAKYFATYDRLKDHLAEWRVAPDRDQPARIARFVDAVERTIASEYGGWASDWAATKQAPK